MLPKLLYILIPFALLIVALVLVFFWDRSRRGQARAEVGNGLPEGAFRSFYHALWILILWTGLVLSLPLWISFREKVGSLQGWERWFAVGKLLAFPAVLLLVLRYGSRRGDRKSVV